MEKNIIFLFRLLFFIGFLLAIKLLPSIQVPEWETVEIPFNRFKNLKDNKDSNINAKDIKTFGIVAYGRDFKSDLSVSSVEFYY